MKKAGLKQIFLTVFIYLFSQFVYCQKNIETENGTKAVKAGAEYQRSSFYQWLMGKNYRKEWITPVEFPVMLLDTAKGGLTAYKPGGGHQTKALHVKTKNEKEFTLRSVDKTLGKVLPQITHNTFIEDVVNDEVSMSHPYGAAAVPLMAEYAGIYHTWPQYVYLPKQPSLDTFNKKFGNTLYLFEQRLSGSWKGAKNLGNFDNFIDTWELLDTLLQDNTLQVDQRLFVKCRLFDMFIGDWDRHEDQWEWGLKETQAGKFYQPVPQDRDQAFFKFDGKLLKLLISAAGLNYFQPFGHHLKDVKSFNYEERNLDRAFTNEMTLGDWQNVAKELQQSLRDNVIEASVKQLPPEAFAISGIEIIGKLKSRRDHLVEYATDYYKFIAKEVEIVGSKRAEAFEVNRINDEETAVKVFRISKGMKQDLPYYSRLFKSGETREVRLFGLSGNDLYTVSGAVNRGITVRIIGGDDRDSIVDLSKVQSGGKTQVYDDANNWFITSKETKLHMSPDTAIHSYNYFGYLYDKKGIGPAISYNYEDRLYTGLKAKIVHHKWREKPFAGRHQIGVNYSISQHAMSVTYEGLVPKAAGNWDLQLKGNYDAIRWTKFFGLGNETAALSNYNDFYRMQSEEWLASVGLNRKLNHNDISVSGFFQSVRVIDDAGRFVPKVFKPSYPFDLHANNFAGANIAYIFDKVNDSIVPTKGLTFSTNATYSHNLSQSGKNFTKYYSSLQLYLPLLPKLSLSIKTAGVTVSGNPLFYQHASIGGPESLRGYRLDRFWGKTAFYNTNEIRYLANIRSYVFNGKAGLLALFDQGRVWMPNESSDAWHIAYGAGILLAPFNKISVVVTYAISPEMKLFQIRAGRSF